MTRTLDSCGLLLRPLYPSAFLALLALAPVALGDVYQGYNYPVGSSIAAGSLSDPSGTLATSGNHLVGDENHFHGGVQPLETYGTPGTDVWISWLQRRDRNVVQHQGLNMIHRVGSQGTGTYFIGDPGFGPGDNTYVIGRAGDDETVVSSGVPVVPNETAFLVVHIEFREGNDLATLYVNPLPGAAAPTGGVTYSGLDMPEIRPVFLLQSSGLTDVTYEFDELRIASTFAFVAPAVPEPSAAIPVLLAIAAVRRPRR